MLISLIVALISIPFDVIYRIKWFIAYIAIYLHNAFQRRRLDLYDSAAERQPEKTGFLVPQPEINLESPFPEEHLQDAADEVLFYGVNSKAECLLVRITRGSNQAAEAWIFLKLANGKTYHLSEHANFQQPFDGKCLLFSCGNLQMHYLTAMRKWRIHFCGLLKEQNIAEDMVEEATVFVKFAFIWSASSDVFDFSSDCNTNSIAKAMARSDWTTPFCPPYLKFLESLNSYAQVGPVWGTVSVNEKSDYEMYLFGEKIRNLGNSSTLSRCIFNTVLGYIPENGYAFHLMKISVPHIYNNLPAGFIVHPSGAMDNVEDLDINIKPFSIIKETRDIQANFKAGSSVSFNISGNISQEPIVLYSGEGWNGFVELSFLKFKYMDKKGYGLVLSGEIYDEQKKSATPTLRLLQPRTVPLTVKFTEEISQFEEISGGKGSSLGKLTKLSNKDKTFTVPKGIIVTTSAYKEFLSSDILKQIKNLEDVTYGNIEGDMKETCEILSKNIVKSILPEKIQLSIIENLKQVFGDIINDCKFAVRSSATGEDTDVMSAAGQMDTFLGVQGIDEIFLAVKKCWASQFGHIAIEYKRQNGQLLNSPMAVVIQEMVACEVSGVLFTCDPVTNNPSVVTITANYGLGETVVSGSVEPDTIMLQRNVNDRLELKSINIGSKHQKIVMLDSGGIKTEDLPEDSKEESCISKETAQKLGKLAIRVEKYYRSSRDIEWGILKKQIYLLQSRPVTSGASFSEFEIKHEFDSPLRCERDYSTLANVGEVMPGATSPLGADLILKYIPAAFSRKALDCGKVDVFAKSIYYPTGLLLFCNHVFMSVINIICRYGSETMLAKGFMISIFGRILEEPEIFEIIKERDRGEPNSSSSFWDDLKFIKDLFFHDWNVEKVKNIIDNYELSYLKCQTAEEAFAALMLSCSDFDMSFIQHIQSTECSSHWNVMMFILLVKAKGSFDTDVYSDFSRLLATSSNLESADIPSSMQNVALQIVEDLGKEKFTSMNLEEAELWLNTSKTSAGEKYRQFIKRHGHRCLKEFDVYSTTWGQDQKILIRLLQTLSGSVREIELKEEDSYSVIFSELRVPLNILNRLLLRFLLPNCRKAVRSREAGKSILIKSMDHWRKGYQHLSKLMVAEGRIPDKDLIFFMTINEIKDLLETRYPKIIARANSRRKLFAKLEQYKFEEIIRGVPKPLNEDEDVTDNRKYISDLTMQGIPVSQGVIKGYCRVATSMEEAALLKPGEILIAYSTDIGWSPYFPIISGVVTELGGLISHGAVVSREYGLPCVVGLRGATKMFNTGDYVLLDGKKGILQRLPPPFEE